MTKDRPVIGKQPTIRVLDLTVDQVEQVELATGLAMDKWGQAPSQMALFRAVYVVATGVSDAEVGRMTLRDISDAVSLEDDEGAADPT